MIFVKPGKRSKVCSDIKDRSQLTKDEWKVFTKGIWEIPSRTDPGHPATFPIELAERVIRMYSFVDDLVLDPFVGSGTTLIAAEKHERIGIGFEISSEYQDVIKDKSAKWLQQLSLPLMT